MRIGLIGDIHADSLGLARAITLLKRNRADCLLAVGDVVDGRGDVDACCDMLMRNGVRLVRGNHERWMLSGQMRGLRFATRADSLSRRSRRFLAGVPTHLQVKTPHGSIVLAHGIGDDDMRGLPKAPRARLIEALRAVGIVSSDCIALVGGHSHRRQVLTLGGVTLVGLQPLRSRQFSCGVFNSLSRSMRFLAV